MLEVKKSRQADLDRGWLQRFLIGLVFAGCCLYVGLEYSVAPVVSLDDSEFFEMLAGDEELSPLLRPESELALVPKAEAKPTVRLVVVDEELQSETLADDEPVETDANNDMEAVKDDELAPPPPVDDEAIAFRVVQDMPQFPGGATEFMKWLTRNLKYPKNLEQQKVQGRVVAEFIVNTDGSITDVNIVKPFHPQCDREVLRVLRMMPRWTPGIQDAKPCRTKVCIPVVFRI
ncbi:MAG: energy transducer TonB [Prevotella sp.]|nr:energy transducer TonB [Prevotella sp.]MDE6011764.1 energy transducer TonB [Prevotella sp.]